jgi:hypothetical protein
VKRPVPRSRRTEPKTPWGIPTAQAVERNREHTRCGHTQFRLGGRNRSDASRVFHTRRSQDLLVIGRALARKKSVAPPDAGRGWTEGESVRVCGIPKQSSHAWPAGLKSLQVLDTMEGVLGLMPVLLSPGRAKQESSARRSTPPSRSARAVKAWPARRADWIPTRVCLRVTKGRQRSTRLGEGSSRTEKVRGGSASSTLKWRRFSGAPDRERPKLTTANSFVDPPLP